MGCSLPWNSPGKNSGVGYHFFLQADLPNAGIKPRSSALQADALPSVLLLLSHFSRVQLCAIP